MSLLDFPLHFFQGTSIGKCPKDKLFRGYIELELQLREFDRCRKLYEKFLEFSPENCTTWMKVVISDFTFVEFYVLGLLLFVRY